MAREDRSWMSLPRGNPLYKDGVIYFLNKAFGKSTLGNQISCPCKKCRFGYIHNRDTVYDHLMGYGFVKGYTDWSFHGEGLSSTENEDLGSDDGDENMHDDVEELLHDRFRDVLEGVDNPQESSNVLNEEAKKFYRLMEEGKEELYPGCKSFSKLSFTIRAYLFKCLHGLSNAAFSDFLEIFREAIPDAKIPRSFHEAKSIVKDLGLDYEKIHACPNDCMIYWKEHKTANFCHICGASRWKFNQGYEGDADYPSSNKPHQIPVKVLRHFPLKPRLQRLFMCSQTAEFMAWHKKNRQDDGILRHPADGQAWKEFDSSYPGFAEDPRNVRLGLASDGFNPFGNMSVSHSIWPVVLINYNLPPWMCLKADYFMLSLLIPGPQSPGNDIDVYMQPLVEELKELWEFGLMTYDTYNKESFRMHAALLWTISDFPGYAMLSGWSTKGKLACPCCNYETCSKYLRNSRKMCYMGHRRFLDLNHPWRHDEKCFDGNIEERPPPTSLSSAEVFQDLADFTNKFGKKHKKKKVDSDRPWKKKSVLFDLPYWQHNSLRHNLDVMHIEKNICDNVIATLLDIPGKTKDHVKGRFDMQDMQIRKSLHPILSDNGNYITLAKACFSMTSEEKDTFCSVFKEVKLPYGCASNIARCVQAREKRISGYKSHDAHIMLQYLLQVAVRKTLPKRIALALTRLGAFFRAICSKAVRPQDLDRLQTEIIEILCEFEIIFPPSFFDIMVHLPIHLVNEIKLGGPVHYRWMFWVERFLGKLKSYVRNRSRPEGSIAEGYLAEECLTFCSRYMHHGAKMKSNKQVRSYDEALASATEDSLIVFPMVGHPIGGKNNKKGKTFTLDDGTLSKAHRYALFNSDNKDIQRYIEQHQISISRRAKRSRWARAQDHSKEFPIWFMDKVNQEQNVPDHIYWVAMGPNPVAKRFSGYFVNGYRFHTKKRDTRCKTQNSGVTVTALTSSFASSRDQNPITGNVTYYGVVNDIVELNYYSYCSVVLFLCDWFQVENDDYGLTRVNFNKLCYKDDPFVLASQVHQVFYVQDPLEHECYYVMRRVPRDIFDMEEEERDINAENIYWEEFNGVRGDTSSAGDVNWTREDVPASCFDVNFDVVDPSA